MKYYNLKVGDVPKEYSGLVIIGTAAGWCELFFYNSNHKVWALGQAHLIDGTVMTPFWDKKAGRMVPKKSYLEGIWQDFNGQDPELDEWFLSNMLGQ